MNTFIFQLIMMPCSLSKLERLWLTYSFPLSERNFLMSFPNCVYTIWQNWMKTWGFSDLSFIKRMSSHLSTIINNGDKPYHAWNIRNRDRSPNIRMNKTKRFNIFTKTRRRVAQWCLVNSQISYLKDSTYYCENKDRNVDLINENEGCIRCLCWSETWVG